MIGTIKEASLFFNNSPKRQQLLEEKIDELMPKTTVHKIVDLCRTRWVHRIDALDVSENLLEATTAALDDIKSNHDHSWNAENVAQANRLYHNIFRFEFVMAL